MGSYVIEEMLDWSEYLKTEVIKLKNGATVIDCGVKEEGGYEAGMYLARLCLVDLADLQYTTFDLKGLKWPAIQIATDNPVDCLHGFPVCRLEDLCRRLLRNGFRSCSCTRLKTQRTL
jgi:methenyltetrahydromethanopterin cyclohydrolase